MPNISQNKLAFGKCLKYNKSQNMNIEEHLANSIPECAFLDLNFVRDIEYPTELNALIVVAKNGKRYRVSVTEEQEEREFPFDKVGRSFDDEKKR